jgi:valyl-tRNA synthetase
MILHEQEVDKSSERSRLQKEKKKLECELKQVESRLANRQFRERAPRGIIEATEQRHLACTSKYQKLVETLARLG